MSEISLEGKIIKVKRITTVKGGKMAIFTLKTLEDVFEGVMFPDAFAKHGTAINEGEMVAVHGKQSDGDGTVSFIALKMNQIK